MNSQEIQMSLPELPTPRYHQLQIRKAKNYSRDWIHMQLFPGVKFRGTTSHGNIEMVS